MKKILSLLTALVFCWVFLTAPAVSMAQDENNCCDNLTECEELLINAESYCIDLEEQNLELEAALTASQIDPPDIPLNGLLHSLAFYRNLPAWAKVLISGTLTLGILAGTMYLEKQSEVLP